MARLIKRSGTEEVNAMFYLLLRTFINPQQPLRSEFSITPAYLLRSLMFGWRKFHEARRNFQNTVRETLSCHLASLTAAS